MTKNISLLEDIQNKKRKTFLIHEAAKKVVFDLRSESPFFSNSLSANVFITKKYLQHILYAKRRDIHETEERLIISAFLDLIIKDGILKETEEENFFQLDYPLKKETLSVVILLQNKKHILLSSFVKYKKNPPV